MILETICVMPGQTNCYLFGDSDTKEICVIDPGGEAHKLLSKINDGGYRVTCILLTHGHFDHILAAKAVQDETGAKLYMGVREADFLTNGNKNMTSIAGLPYEAPRLDVELMDGDVVLIGKQELRVITTPGHTAGGVSYVGNGIVFSGDTLFCENVGRTDFVTGNMTALRKSLQKLAQLPDDYEVYPGHGPATAMGHEKRFNPYMAGELNA